MDQSLFFHPEGTAEILIYEITRRLNRLHATSFEVILDALLAVAQWYAASLARDEDARSIERIRTRSGANQSMNPTSKAQAGEVSRDDGHDAGESARSDV